MVLTMGILGKKRWGKRGGEKNKFTCQLSFPRGDKIGVRGGGGRGRVPPFVPPKYTPGNAHTVTATLCLLGGEGCQSPSHAGFCMKP